MNVLKMMAVVMVLLGLSSATSAFDERQMKGGSVVGPADAGAGTRQVAPGSGKGLELTTPDLPSARSSGTKIRIPGLGIIGEIPELDFKLDLLYGANQPKRPLDIDRDSEASGVMGRVRVPLKSP